MSSSPTAASRSPRQDNRRIQLLDAAAHLFNERGFHATSMRDIAKEVGMLSGSIYYHFQSKEEMLLAVYEQGMQRIADEVARAVAEAEEPWQRLEAACAAHLRGLLAYHDYAIVMIRTLPSEAGTLGPRIRELRRAFEARFRALIDDLALPEHIDRRYVLLMLFGALNWSHVWYRPGSDSPETVARRFLDTLKCQLELPAGDALRAFATP
ncbi:MAG TPA: TetR/AcrR family transcriptional regulator [Candidatus Binataceae bacterium]|nr:TetR/AcrR family transcriptional regulator [Candidatus Binataceae bacterium]